MKQKIKSLLFSMIRKNFPEFLEEEKRKWHDLHKSIEAVVVHEEPTVNVQAIIQEEKRKWEAEQRYIKNVELLKIEQEKAHEEERRIQADRRDSERRKKTSEMYKNNIRKGKEYELFINKYFYDQGYQTREHGLIHGREDKGIDLIIMKNKVITLIQCKNWKADSKKKINHIMIKEFIGNTQTFIEKNKDKAENYTIERMYIVANDVLDKSAKNFIHENRSVVEFLVIPMKAS